jgi:tetratricopeptide (TPR) repeat protein
MDKPWSLGDYRAEIYLNDDLAKTLPFVVVAGSSSTPVAGATSTLSANASVPELLEEVDRLTFKSKFDDAITLYKQANQAEPRNANVLVRWGRALLFQQKFREAIERLESATRLDPNSADAWGYLALSYDWTFRFDEANEAIDRALRLAPNSADLHAFKAEIILDRNDDVVAADREAQLALSLGQNRAAVQRAIAIVAKRKSSGGLDVAQLAIAEQAYKRAVELEPELYLRYYELGVLYLEMNRIPQAIETFQKSISLYNQAAAPHFGLGRAYQINRDCEKASIEFRLALSIDPSYQSAREALEACR